MSPGIAFRGLYVESGVRPVLRGTTRHHRFHLSQLSSLQREPLGDEQQREYQLEQSADPFGLRAKLRRRATQARSHLLDGGPLGGANALSVSR